MKNVIDRQLEAQRRQTRNLINTAGRDIQLFRPPALVDDGAGGKRRDTTQDLRFPEKQRFLAGITSQGSNSNPLLVQFVGMGELYKSFFVLIGEDGDDIKAGDYFFIEQDRYDVLFLHHELDQYQTKASVGLRR